MSDLYKKIVKELEEAGYELARTKAGSHRKWKAPNRPPVFICHKINDINLARDILKHAGLKLRL